MFLQEFKIGKGREENLDLLILLPKYGTVIFFCYSFVKMCSHKLYILKRSLDPIILDPIFKIINFLCINIWLSDKIGSNMNGKNLVVFFFEENSL